MKTLNDYLALEARIDMELYCFLMSSSALTRSQFATALQKEKPVYREPERETLKNTEIESDTFIRPAIISSGVYGTLYREERRIVYSKHVKESGNYKHFASEFKWPETFYMEMGSDLRSLSLSDPKRHAIDWYRTVTLDESPQLPCLDKFEKTGNPYSAATEMAAFDKIKELQAAPSTNLIDEIAKERGGKKDMKLRMYIIQILKDLSLYGFITPYTQKKGYTTPDKTVYVYHGAYVT